MKTKNERITAAYVVDTVIQRGKNLTEALEQYDITPYTQELCFGTLRFYFQLRFYLNTLLKKKLVKKYAIFESVLLVALYELTFTHTTSYAVTNETVNAAKILEPRQKWIHALLNAILRNYLRQKKSLDALYADNPVFKYAHPQWLITAVEKNWDTSILQANNQYPPLYLRVNLLKISRADYLTLLANAHIEAIASPVHPCAIQVIKPCTPNKLPGFFDGLCSIQDLGAQYAASLLQLDAGLRVLDACAAPGGKTTHILESDDQLQEVIAVDCNEGRCDKIKENLQRLSLNATVLCADAAEPEQYWDKIPFDRILLDVPCSATGVIRRHPDIKLLRHASDIAQFVAQQKKLLHNLWPLLKCNGLLLYATCSILPDENESIIADFLANTPAARAERIHLAIGRTLTFGHQILPGEANADGFYYAMLRRIAIDTSHDCSHIIQSETSSKIQN